MSTLLFFATILLTFYSPTHSEWISHPDNTMPRKDTMSAIGSYNDNIYLLGGLNKQRQQTIYDIKTDSFVFYKSGFVPTTNIIFGEAQHWAQIEFNLYILDDLDAQNNKILVFNMAENSFNPNFASIPLPVSDGNGVACIASSSKFNVIFINGGITDSGTSIRDTYVLNIETMSWGLAPQMQTARRSHSCIIHPNNNVLYSIGGYSSDSLTDTIEKMQITGNIDGSQWTYSNGTLIRAVEGCRAFVFGNYIVIIPGWRKKINILDTTNDLVTVHNEQLSFPSAYSAVIMVNNIMYSFAGGLSRFGMDTWQSSTILSPTTTPSPISNTPGGAPALPIMVTNPKTTIDDYFNFTTTEILDLGEIEFTTANMVGIGAAVALLVCLIIAVTCCLCTCRDNKETD